MRRKLLLSVLGLVAVAVGGFYYYTTTPTYSVLQILNAVQDHDVALFEKHVDVDTLFNRLIDDVMAQQLTKASGDDGSGWGKLGSALGAGMVQMIKPTLVSGLKSSALRYVETGELKKPEAKPSSSSETAQSSTEKASLGGMASKFGLEKGQKFDYQVERRGKVAIVTIPFRNEELDLPLIMQFTLRNEGAYWQLVQFNNAAELITAIEEEQQRRLTEANNKITAELVSKIQFVGSKKLNESDQWGIRKKVYIQITFESMSDKSLTNWTGTIEVLGGDLKPYFIQSANAVFEKPLSRGMQESLVWEVDINQFKDGHAKLWASPEGQLNVRLKTSKLGFLDGTAIEQITTYSDLFKVGSRPPDPANQITVKDDLLWSVQIASLSSKEGAEKVEESLKKAGYDAYMTTIDGVHRIFCGPYKGRASADLVKDQLQRQQHLAGFVVRYDEAKVGASLLLKP
jgi:hypothetical protein